MRDRGPRWVDVGLTLSLVVGAAAMMFPFLWTVVTSLTPDATLAEGPTLLVSDPTLDAYRQLDDSLPIVRIILNSLGVASVSTLLQMTTGAMGAYAFSRLQFPGKRVVFTIYVATLMIPLQVLVVPLFIQLSRLDLNDTYFALIAPSMASGFGVFMLRQAMDQVPRELDEAATLDGADHLRIFLRVIVPLVRPALATVAVLAFVASWNGYLWPLVVIRSPELMTLPLGLATLQGQFTRDWDLMMAGSVVSILPIVAVFLVAQRHVIAGFAHSGLK